MIQSILPNTTNDWPTNEQIHRATAVVADKTACCHLPPEFTRPRHSLCTYPSPAAKLILPRPPVATSWRMRGQQGYVVLAQAGERMERNCTLRETGKHVRTVTSLGTHERHGNVHFSLPNGANCASKQK